VGRPVLLASPVTDTPVDRLGCGIRYQPGSIAELAQAISNAVGTDFETRQMMGARGQLEAAERYNLHVTGEQLDALLASVVFKSRNV
jgi:glycosyltransferase involved in cell wall biosynthesis